MTWLFSKAMMEAYASSPCSPALAAEFSVGTCSAGEPWSQLNVMPTPHKFWRNDKTMEPSDLSRFGLTLQLLTEDRGTTVLMSFLADFPARTSASQGGAQGSTARAAACGRNTNGFFAKYDRERHIWKTAQCSLLGDSDEFSQTWPNWGSMRNGECSERTMPKLAMSAKGFGFWPTPTARDARTLSGSQPPKRAPTSGIPLAWTIALTINPESRSGGRLTPEWVEWLMGWPMGWTDLKPLATDKFREWQRQHGGFFPDQG